MDQTYKARKEAFVSNLSGGEITEINSVTLVASTAVLLWSALQSRISFFTPYSAPALVVDFLLNVGAILFSFTVYSSSSVLLNILLASPAILLLLSPKRSWKAQKAKPPRSTSGKDATSKQTSSDLDPFPVHPFLTTYRAAMMIATCVAILAVDFRVFPRRFAKVENWGTSLMDLGVGSFVFSAGVVSARSVLKEQSRVTLPRRLIASIRHSIPLFVLGFIRLLSVKGLDYAEHVTEYGVHWNFFFTLALLPPFVEIFHSLTAVVPWYELLALTIAVAYQVALESTDLKGFILVSPRGPDLLSKNREGVFSFIGYLAIFLAGRASGVRIIPRGTGPSKTPQQARRNVLISLALETVVWSGLFFFNSTYAFGYGAGIPVSRRLANMPYVLWIAAFNNAQLFVFCLIETVFFPSAHQATDKDSESEQISFATSRVMAAFNKNGLAVFLVANLLTGAVNLGIHTLDAKTPQAMAVLMVYAAAVTAVAMGLDWSGIKLKL
ncbi:hypothetical protein DTO027B5_6166 [Paecilomyces variotii]|nr:hypothetical protein DTO021C3_8981 [Paecilomyces variotii]KAJ9322118.1 hypothetical protein DTO027B3_6837 [Paecilomyces variotii]KAJ9332027.1 hypothetical protein DTO027B5_6166 [Paecilomyces variotii]KAJ9395882.1 hypothetical protein DTO282F9_7253 [Paecilomyces variotii]KAJ9404920.1 hypothetical protein DTO045G8_7384 [Paecilomyces variotii]